MPERRGTRFLVEVLFLAALATALALAHLDALELIGAMAVGWGVVATLEWAVWRGEPHYGSGLPPRYYVPSVTLPPPQPLEQVEQGYPDASREEAPTWIASAALRAEVLGAWPLAAPAEADDDGEEEAEPEFAAASEPGADPWTVAALPDAPLDEVEDEPELQPRPARKPATVIVSSVPIGRVARYSIDPLGDPVPKRRFGRRDETEPAETVEVAARPHGARALPGDA
ncbi:MAG: hypothetical protein ACXVQQ_03040 [Gaiellaceae bacterium]